jgi:hypothetical protein
VRPCAWRLQGALHGAAERHAALELLSHALGDQGRVDFRLAHFDEVEEHFAVNHLRDLAAQLLDVRTLFTDHHTRTSRVDRDAAFLVRALDDDLRHRRVLEFAF